MNEKQGQRNRKAVVPLLVMRSSMKPKRVCCPSPTPVLFPADPRAAPSQPVISALRPFPEEWLRLNSLGVSHSTRLFDLKHVVLRAVFCLFVLPSKQRFRNRAVFFPPKTSQFSLDVGPRRHCVAWDGLCKQNQTKCQTLIRDFEHCLLPNYMRCAEYWPILPTISIRTFRSG